MHSLIRNSIFASLAATAVLSAPTAAHAAYTGDGTRLVGDAASDNLVIGVAGGNYTHNQTGGGFNSSIDFDPTTPGDQTILATEPLVVLAGDGDDAVTGPTEVTGPIAVAGEGGDDTITGGRAADKLSGGPGDDRLIGARGNDLMSGDAGNDTLVWNNGDGSDDMRGGAGNDEIEVNGAATAGDAFTLAQAVPKVEEVGLPAFPADIEALFPFEAPNVLFRRTNLGPFALDISTSERMTVNGSGGDDEFVADDSVGTAILVTADGGTGDDHLVGTPGADLLTGGDGNDLLEGAGGDDELVGDRGADTMRGDEGDDTLEWNNGDGSDVMEGGEGTDRIEVNGSTTAGDVFTVAPNGPRALFKRTNFGPFSLDIGTAEALDANGQGGNDTFTADAGIASLLALDIDGGSGDDTLTGAEGDDTLVGGSGNDTITPLGGADLAEGGEGDDQLFGRDGGADLLRCGPGNDWVQTDEPGVDTVTGCETVDALPAPPAPVAPAAPAPSPVVPTAPAAPQTPTAELTPAATPLVKFSSLRDRKRKGRHTLRFTAECPTGPVGCSGEVRLTTASAVNVGGVKVKVLLATTEFDLQPGQKRTLTVTLPKGAQRFARGGKLRLRLGTGDQSVKRTVKLAK